MASQLPSGARSAADNGWQISGPGRTLFPGGPFSYKAVTPDKTFYFGVSQEFQGEGGRRRKLFVSDVGLAAPSFDADYVLTAVETAEAKRRIARIIAAYPRLFSAGEIVAIEFRDHGEPVQEVF